ncbi:MAG: insulinase family protein [Deltaproteobacteria bacterium]|nr:insulinase family protein [Deltaproteobacteria bacterium]
MPQTPWLEGQESHGFALAQIAPLPELNATLYRLEHRVTGARYLHLATADDNNLFAVGFRTPPRDATGAPHILEHTTLCGSRRYPVRDPFFSMIRRSLNTFMNAMTAADWTLYPFSSQNAKDLYNLLDVYLDAVFFPLLRERDFRQEGWRLELADPSDPTSALEYKGVVYNEMKGAMADPHSLLSQRVAEALYPTTTYGFNSGGEPSHIPDLTWQGLRAFHETCYHPSNAYFFTCGDLPLERHLEAVAVVLAPFRRREVDTAVADEARFAEPRRVRVGCPVEPGEPSDGKAMVQVAWLNGPAADSTHRVSMNLLSALLLGTPAAPLYKVLLDSKLGANLAPGTGYNDENRQTCFEVGLQGTEPDRTGAIEELILATLVRLADEGFPRDRIEAAIHRLEFAHREVRGDHYPYGLSLLSRVMGPWIHGGDPVSALSLSRDLDAIRKAAAEGPFFQDLIRRELLNNPHRVTVTLAPDPAFSEREDRLVRERLEAVRRDLGEEGCRRLVDQAEELRRAQEAEDDLSCLPTLELSDIPPEERPVPSQREVLAPVPIRWFDQPTNGIAYCTSYLEAADLEPELQPYLPLFCGLLAQVGAAGFSYTEMAERIEASTGGVGAAPAVLDDPGVLGAFRPMVAVQGKALLRNQGRMFEILADLFTAPEFGDLKRLATVVGQIRTNLDNSVPNVGHRYAARVAAASLSPAAALRERWSGVEHIRLVRRVAALAEADLGDFSERLGQLAAHLFGRARLRCGVTGEARTFPEIHGPLKAFLSRLGDGVAPFAAEAGVVPATAPCRRGLATSVPVCYVARVYPCVAYTHPDAPGLLLLAKLLKSNYLHREIREKGGAYGGLAAYDAEGGLFSLLSYRDPHLARTLRVYDEAVDWASAGEFGGEEIKESVLGVFSDLDRPLSPSGKGEREFASLVQGLTAEMRQRFREGVLAADRDRLVSLAETYLAARRERSAVAVVAAEEALSRANEELGDEALEIERL